MCQDGQQVGHGLGDAGVQGKEDQPQVGYWSTFPLHVVRNKTNTAMQIVVGSGAWCGGGSEACVSVDMVALLVMVLLVVALSVVTLLVMEVVVGLAMLTPG